MRAIVLTCDKYHQFTQHMIKCYEDLWPSCNLTFRVPYQNSPPEFQFIQMNNIEFVQTPPDIFGTLRTLIQDLPSGEWVYWCIDDKYPIQFNWRTAEHIQHWTSKDISESVISVLFCRCRRLLEPKNLNLNKVKLICDGISTIPRVNSWQIWIHQFVRVSMIEWIISHFPERNFEAREMDNFLIDPKSGDARKFPVHLEALVTEKNFAIFGESTSRGRITRNCKESFMHHGLTIPNVPTHNRYITTHDITQK